MATQTQKTPKTPYDVLGVDTTATQDDIKNAWRSLAKKSHPDANGGIDGGFNAIKKAYELLADPKKRKVYDTLNGVVNQPQPAKYQSPGVFTNQYYPSSGSSYVGYTWPGFTNMGRGVSSGSVKPVIRIPRQLIYSASISTNMPTMSTSFPLGILTSNTKTMIEATILMRGIQTFKPGDVLALEYRIHGQSDDIEVEVIKVMYEMKGNDTIAAVIGEQV